RLPEAALSIGHLACRPRAPARRRVLAIHGRGACRLHVVTLGHTGHFPPRGGGRPPGRAGIIGSMSQKPGHERDHGVAVEVGRPEVARPPLYSVLILNDDYTPMDFVVEVLVRFFGMDIERATQVM